MIVYTVRCEKGHEFEGWFGSSASFESEAAAGEVACPQCGSTRIEKAPMAPAIAGGKSDSPYGCPGADCAPEAAPCLNGCGGACFPR